ncbi:MAG: GNAT family N-acetyltransferase [Pseudomonadota bacterium]|nr:GNAT family N-acetyltransferase [Pseudomonadota bacterium]
MPRANPTLQQGPISIRRLDSITALKAAHKVMAELRPHLDLQQFLVLVQEMRGEGYRVAGLFDGGTLRAVAGYRVLTMLVRGRSLYVDDLVTTAEMRGKGYGKLLLDWLMREARRQRCNEFHLDSGVQRFAAHAFYFSRGLHIASYHFATGLK